MRNTHPRHRRIFGGARMRGLHWRSGVLEIGVHRLTHPSLKLADAARGTGRLGHCGGVLCRELRELGAAANFARSGLSALHHTEFTAARSPSERQRSDQSAGYARSSSSPSVRVSWRRWHHLRRVRSRGRLVGRGQRHVSRREPDGCSAFVALVAADHPKFVTCLVPVGDWRVSCRENRR